MIDRHPAASKETSSLSSEPAPTDDQDAEAVRQHLVVLRGGAPFLSPDDASLLDEWLQRGLTVPTIVHALERAADARRRRPSKVPFSLRAARTHLGKPGRSALGAASPGVESGAHPLLPVVDGLRSQARGHPRHTALTAVAQSLLDLDPHAQDLEQQALTISRDFLLSSWSMLSAVERGHHLTRAREELVEVADLLSAEAFEASAEALARDTLRQAFPLLSAATLHQVLSP
jgi:hypothetical protein